MLSARTIEAAAFAFLTYHSAVAAYSLRNETRDLLFVAFSYTLLAILFRLVGALERTRPAGAGGGKTRRRLTAAVWVVAVGLDVGFAYRVAKILPLGLAMVVWCTALVVAALGFWLLFLGSMQLHLSVAT